ncbi:MAG: protein kinase [Candidatus Aminicenantes bacterium]|nr:protein kinase [Candidatus Aminicenantes bacterium]
MICPSCGAANDEQDRFCSRCRAPLQAPEDKTDESAPRACRPGGTILGGRFRVIKSLGRGGMGEILLAEDVKLGRKVAIKSIAAAVLSDFDSKARFLREAQAASRLDQANICMIYEIAEESGREFIVMQYVDGVTLDQLMKMKPLALETVVDIALQIADGMAAAQGQDIVHRDIKPGNIMIDRSGQVKILDFGLAKICPAAEGEGESERDDRDLTEKGIVLGTVSYMSPEQAKGLKLDGRSDIFSFGVVLYEMIENRNPFAEKENIVTLYNILHREVRFSPHVPPPLQRIVRKAMQKDRSRRYGDFSEIRRDLADWKAGLARKAEQPRNETEIIAPREQKRLLRESDRRRPLKEDERLSEMVRRLKDMKASTEALRTSRSRRWWLAAALLPLVALLAWLVFLRPGRLSPGAGTDRVEWFSVLLTPFENQTREKQFEERIHYLVRQALESCGAFRTLDEEMLRELNGGHAIAPERLPALMRAYRVRYVLRGKLSSVADKFNIEAQLERVNERERHAPFFIPGKERNSLLTDQVDNLALRVLQAVRGEPDATAPTAPGIAAMYGGHWRAFELFYQGWTLWNKKQFSSARRLLLEAERLAGGMPAARYHLALLEDYSGSSAEALKYVDSLVPLLEQFSLPLRLKVQALKAKFDFAFPEQIRCLRELKAMFPFSKERILELGEAYFRRGDAARAIPEFLSALEMDRDYAAALNHLGYCYSYLGRHQEAIECFERYRDIDRTANSFDSLGDGHFYRGDYTQAENSKVYAISLDPGMDWPYLTIADIHVLKANFPEAEKALSRYQELAAHDEAKADTLAKMAFLRYLDEDYAAALRLLDQALLRHDSAAITGHSAESHWLKGLCHAAQNDLPAARRELLWLQVLRDAYRLSLDNFDAALKYCLHLEARIAEKEARPRRARDLFRDLLSMKTQLSFWITYYSYPYFETEHAEFLLRQGDLPAAGEAIARCLAFNSNYTPALWAKVRLLRAAGDDSREVLEQIAAIYGSGAEDNALRRRLASERKE